MLHWHVRGQEPAAGRWSVMKEDIALLLTPSSSITVAILSIPVSRRRLQISGDSLGIVLAKARRTNDRISIDMPKAANQLR